MNKETLATGIKNVQMWTNKHAPEILTGFGIAGMFTTTVLAVKATPKALKLIEQKKAELDVQELTTAETVKAAWKPYVIPAATAVVSTMCLIGANSMHVKRNTALATVYQLSATALSEFKDKAVETVGEKKVQAIRDAIDKDHIEKNPVSKSDVIITDKGNTLCYDHISGRYFFSDIDKIKRAVNDLNHRMLHDMFGYVSVNDLYDELGLEHIMVGDELGWNVNELIDIYFGSQISDDGRPAIVLNYDVAPRRNYTTIM